MASRLRKSIRTIRPGVLTQKQKNALKRRNAIARQLSYDVKLNRGTVTPPASNLIKKLAQEDEKFVKKSAKLDNFKRGKKPLPGFP